MTDQGKGRIAIKFGGAFSANTTSRATPPSTLGKRPRPHALGGGSDSEPDDDGGHGGRHEAITGFGAHGAETEHKARDTEKKKAYIIARQPNRNWKADLKEQHRGKNLLSEESRSQKNATTVDTEPADRDKSIKWGLTVKETRPVEGTPEDEANGDAAAKNDATTEKKNVERKDRPPATADDEAMDALLGRKPDKPLAVIPSEDDAYQRDVQEAGAASTLEDYEAMPVEEFGAALLRGMGWDGKSSSSKPKEVRRRPNRLGLGAKELKEDEDLGAWNQKGKRSRPRLNDYRREEEKRKESRRHENSYRSERDRERDHDRRHRDGDRHRDRYRDMDRDYDRRRDQHRDHDRVRR